MRKGEKAGLGGLCVSWPEGQSGKDGVTEHQLRGWQEVRAALAKQFLSSGKFKSQSLAGNFLDSELYCREESD